MSLLSILPTATTVPYPQAAGYDASIDELYLRLAVAPDRQMRIESAPSQAQRISTAQTAEDFIPDQGVVFSRNDFTGGEGLAIAHRSNAGETDSTRFWDSKGVDISAPPSGQLPKVRLLHDTGLVKAEVSVNPLRMALLHTGDLVFTVGNILRKITDPTGAATDSIEDPHTGTQAIKDVAVLGNQAYAACGSDGTAWRNSSGTWADLGATQTDRLWAVKRRLIGLNGSVVVEVNTSTGAHTTLLTLPSGAVVNDVTDGDAVILISASDGYIYAVRDDGGTLALQSQTRISPFEEPVAISSTSGVVLISTRAKASGTTYVGRLYAGNVSNNTTAFAVTNLQLIKEFGVGATDNIDHSHRRMYVARDSIFALGQWDATETHLWKYSLKTGGISRDLVFHESGPAHGLEVVNGYFFATLVAGADAGLFRELVTTVPEGWLISPAVDFFTPTLKQWVGVRLNSDGFELGGNLAVEYSTDIDAILNVDHPSWFPIVTAFSELQSDAEVAFSNIESRYMALKFTITGEAGLMGVSPNLRSFALRAETQTDDFIVSLPVNVSDRIEPPNRKPFTVPGWGNRIFLELLGREGRTTMLTLLRTGWTFRGVIESVTMPATGIEERGSLTAFALVTIRGTLTGGASDELTGSGAAGVGTLGIEPLGV